MCAAPMIGLATGCSKHFRNARPSMFQQIASNSRKDKYDEERECDLSLLDLRRPHLWYPVARSMRRRVTLHTGPTNSGKTYSALLDLVNAKSGMYCGPLRLLAWEVHERLVRNGLVADLVTGQELDERKHATHLACTAEMADVDVPREAAVIDEIQMMGSLDRGSAFTRAFLGAPVERLHVCGDLSTQNLVEELCDITGDELEVKTYERLTSLTLTRPLLSFEGIRRGDCVVAFGRKVIYAIKVLIESVTPLKVCVVYGQLPPSTRKQQAALFNDANSGYDVLVSSDAIGMGLNFNIKRIVFASMRKFDGVSERLLTTSEVLQIAGRAGRKGTEFESGEVTVMGQSGYQHLERCLEQTPPILEQAGIAPTIETIREYSKYHPDMSLRRILESVSENATIDGTYFASDLTAVKLLSAEIDDQMPIENSYTFCLAPVNPNDRDTMREFKRYAREFHHSGVVRFNATLSIGPTRSLLALEHLEAMHRRLECYIWLANRFPDEFVDRVSARQLSEDVASKIASSIKRILVQKPISYLQKSLDLSVVRSLRQMQRAKLAVRRRGRDDLVFARPTNDRRTDALIPPSKRAIVRKRANDRVDRRR